MKYSSVDLSHQQISLAMVQHHVSTMMNYKERFNVSLGQIYYINPNNDEANLSAWALENEWNITINGFIKADYNTIAMYLIYNWQQHPRI